LEEGAHIMIGAVADKQEKREKIVVAF
jgi:hypothetical protein